MLIRRSRGTPTPSSSTMALKPVSVNEDAKKMLEEEVPKKARHPHTIRYIERKLVDKGFHRMERHPGDGISLARGPPKSGHGGSFTWEGPDSELELEVEPDPEPAALDEADANYVEEEVVKEMVVGEVEVAKVAEAREGVSRIEIRAPDQVAPSQGERPRSRSSPLIFSSARVFVPLSCRLFATVLAAAPSIAAGMAKGDDALRRKRNKVNRKRLRNSESSVSARVAAIIAAKCRRKAGKRRICEGMCFSHPTADDPFNERHEKKAMGKTGRNSKKQKLNRRDNGQRGSNSAVDNDKKLQEKAGCSPDTENMLMRNPVEKTKCNGENGGFENGCVSKFLMLCLKVVEDSWVEEGTLNKDMVGALLSSSWGAEFCGVCSSGSSIVETSGSPASRDMVAWLVSTAADIVARKEKQGIIVASPFLLYIVPSQDRAIEVRAVCKPLKALGIHTVSLHSGTSLDHQVHGLKNCEPEFIVSTAERLLKLVSLKAVDISGTSLLVADGLRKCVDLGLLDNLKSIRGSIIGDPQIITFTGSHGEMPVTELLQHLIRGSVYRLSAHESVATTSSFVSQYIHFYASEDEKLSEVLQILAQTLSKQTAKSSEVLLISSRAYKISPLAAFLNSKGYAVCDDSHTRDLHKTNGEKSGSIIVKDLDNLHDFPIDKFEIVIIVDFPSSINDYNAILTKIARHTLVGVLHSFFSTVDAPLAESLIEVLGQCGQVVPPFLKSL